MYGNSRKYGHYTISRCTVRELREVWVVHPLMVPVWELCEVWVVHPPIGAFMGIVGSMHQGEACMGTTPYQGGLQGNFGKYVYQVGLYRNCGKYGHYTISRGPEREFWEVCISSRAV